MKQAKRLEADFLKEWKKFAEELSACQAALGNDAGRPLWLYDIHSDQARSALVTMIGQVFYRDTQAARESITLPGIVGSSARSLEQATKLNACKNRLRIALNTLDRHLVTESNPATHRKRKIRLSNLVLPAHGLARLHRVQCYRHLRWVDHRPDKVGMTWARTKRVRSTTAQAVIKELERLRGRGRQAPLVERDLENLMLLKPETPLASVHPEPLHARANLAWAQGERGWKRQQVTLALPLLYPAGGSEALPELSPLKNQEQEAHRIRRAGRRLEDEPYLKTLPIYRYQTPVGQGQS